MIKKSLYRYCISCKCVASSWVLDVIACLSFPHMLALCILKMSKPKHGEDYFQESFHVLPQRSNKSFWNKRRVGQEHYFFIPLFNYVGKSALCFLARCIFISSTCAVHLHPLLKLGFFLIIFFLHLEGEWVGLGKIRTCLFRAFVMQAFRSLKWRYFPLCSLLLCVGTCMFVGVCFAIVLGLSSHQNTVVLQTLYGAAWKVNRWAIVGFRNFKWLKLLGWKITLSTK